MFLLIVRGVHELGQPKKFDKPT